MATPTVEDPVVGMRSAFEWRGKVLVMDCWVDPGGYTPLHTHPPLEERFEVIDGEFTFTAAGEETVAGPGDKVTVPPGTKHGFKNTGPAEGHLRCEIDPGLSMEDFFKDSAELAKSGAYTKRGLPGSIRSLPDLAEFVERYKDVTVVASPPPFIQRLVMPPLARLARRRRSSS